MATMVPLCSVAPCGDSRGVSERVHRGLLFTLSGGFDCKGIISECELKKRLKQQPANHQLQTS